MSYSDLQGIHVPQSRFVTRLRSGASAASGARCPSGKFSVAAMMMAGARLLMVMLAAGLPLQALAEVAATVHFASGYVAATAPGAAVRQLGKDDEVYSGDRVDTAENARAQMRFTDGGLVSLMPNTTFSVDEYLHEGRDEDDASLVFGLLRGGLRTVTGAIGKVNHDQYELKTPVATLGIRGTEYVAVLRPANTLRVHVGRGKVVITNDQGELEVPEGRNAVVTLGSAPELTEQGPQYQATGPRGDRLVAVGDIRQDPHLLDPRANMPVPEGPDVPDEIQDPFTEGPPVMLGAILGSQMGSLFNVDPDDMSGSWERHDLGGTDLLAWGYFEGGSGIIGGDPADLSGSPTDTYVMPFITGGSSAVEAMPAGMLTYSLQGGTPAYAFNTDGSEITGALNKFDLGIDLENLQYTLDFELDMPSMARSYGTTPGTGGSLISGSNPSGFSFSVGGDRIVRSDASCASCQLDVQGFLAGSDAEEAGVVYKLEDPISDPSTFSGAAGLRR